MKGILAIISTAVSWTVSIYVSPTGINRGYGLVHCDNPFYQDQTVNIQKNLRLCKNCAIKPCWYTTPHFAYRVTGTGVNPSSTQHKFTQLKIPDVMYCPETSIICQAIVNWILDFDLKTNVSDSTWSV